MKAIWINLKYVELEKQATMDELHADFNKLSVDENELHLKLGLSLKNRLIKKINENSQFIRGQQLVDEKDNMKATEENNQMISMLDSLPVLIEGKPRFLSLQIVFGRRLLSWYSEKFDPNRLY